MIPLTPPVDSKSAVFPPSSRGARFDVRQDDGHRRARQRRHRSAVPTWGMTNGGRGRRTAEARFAHSAWWEREDGPGAPLSSAGAIGDDNADAFLVHRSARAGPSRCTLTSPATSRAISATAGPPATPTHRSSPPGPVAHTRLMASESSSNESACGLGSATSPPTSCGMPGPRRSCGCLARHS